MPLLHHRTSLFLYGQEQGLAVLNKAITACSEAIEEHKGKLVVKEAPRAVSPSIHKSIAFSALEDCSREFLVL